MVQIDLFLSYGMSSGLALAARRHVNVLPGLWVNRYVLATVLWLALLFVPQVGYLLWRFPAWETMFVALDRESIPAWLVAAFPVAMVGLGLLGFVVTARLLRAGRRLAAWLQLGVTVGISLVIVTFGWDGTGYERVLYPGTGAEWAAGKVYTLGDFLTSELALSLVVLEGLLLIPYGIFLFRWSRKTGEPGS